MKEKKEAFETLLKGQDPSYLTSAERKKEYNKEYRARQDVKERRKKQNKEYNARPDVKERQKRLRQARKESLTRKNLCKRCPE
jgi:hypothetical protein